jgi:glutaredoxin
MEMRHNARLIILLLALMSWQCSRIQKEESAAANTISENKPKVHDIVVYGSMTCDHCIEFLKKADSIAVKYTFRDVESNTNYYNELVQKIQQANYQGYVSFPVIEVDGKIHVNPEFAQFQKLIR